MEASLRTPPSATVWALGHDQHGVVTRRQLLDLGLGPQGIKHRVARGRLHRVARGVYAVGRPGLTVHGEWSAAVLACGPHAVLSYGSAAALWEIRPRRGSRIDVSLPAALRRQRPGLVIHRTALPANHVTTAHRIAVTTPARTLLDLAAQLGRGRALELAIDEADKRGLTDPERLRVALVDMAGRRGIVALRATLDRHTFTLTDSDLERRFLPLARRAGLARPLTRQALNGFRVDFYWPDLGLVVETDGLRYHRTPAQQARALIRDQAHAVAGLEPLRFSHAQVAFEGQYVVRTLRDIAERLREDARPIG